MSNKQYVFTGTGSPLDNNIYPDVATAHYVDQSNNDVWMYINNDWQLIYVGGSSGMVAFYKVTDQAPEAPACASIRMNVYGDADFWDGSSWRNFLPSNS